MGPHIYLWLCIRKAFGRALSQVDFFVGIFSAAITVIAKHDPLSGSFFEALSADIILWTLGAVFGVRALMAPYLIWREDQRELHTLRSAAAVDPIAHTLEVTAAIDDNFLDGGDRLRGQVFFKNTGAIPLQVHATRVDIHINGAPPDVRTGAGGMARPTDGFHYKYNFGPEPLQTVPGVIRFDVGLTYGRVGAPASRRLSRTLEAHYRREGRILTSACRTIVDQDEPI